MKKNTSDERNEYFKHAPEWFVDESLMETYAKDGFDLSFARREWVKIRTAVSGHPEDDVGKSLISEMNGLGVITAEGLNGGEGHFFWIFRPHNFDYMDGFPLDYRKIYSFYGYQLNLVRECRLADLSRREAIDLFKNTWCVSHELSKKTPKQSEQ